MLLSASLCCAQESSAFRPASTNVFSSEYPRVDGLSKAQFKVKAPDATKVRLNFWSGPKLDTEKQADGFWTATTPSLAPGLNYYTLIIDIAEVSNPSRHAFYGGSKGASAIEIPEPGTTYYLPQDVPSDECEDAARIKFPWTFNA
jgi:enterochelin esterase family protein